MRSERSAEKSLLCRTMARNAAGDASSAARRIVDPAFSANQFRPVGHDPQAKTGRAHSRGRPTATVIRDCQFDVPGFAAIEFHRNVAWPGMLDRIDQRFARNVEDFGRMLRGTFGADRVQLHLDRNAARCGLRSGERFQCQADVVRLWPQRPETA